MKYNEDKIKRIHKRQKSQLIEKKQPKGDSKVYSRLYEDSKISRQS